MTDHEREKKRCLEWGSNPRLHRRIELKSTALDQLGHRGIPANSEIVWKRRIQIKKKVLYGSLAKKNTPLAGFEPATPGLEVRCAIRCATEAITILVGLEPTTARSEV